MARTADSTPALDAAMATLGYGRAGWDWPVVLSQVEMEPDPWDELPRARSVRLELDQED